MYFFFTQCIKTVLFDLLQWGNISVVSHVITCIDCAVETNDKKVETGACWDVLCMVNTTNSKVFHEEEQWKMWNLRWSDQSLLDEALNRRAVNSVFSHWTAPQLADTQQRRERRTTVRGHHHFMQKEENRNGRESQVFQWLNRPSKLLICSNLLMATNG